MEQIAPYACAHCRRSYVRKRSDGEANALAMVDKLRAEVERLRLPAGVVAIIRNMCRAEHGAVDYLTADVVAALSHAYPEESNDADE